MYRAVARDVERAGFRLQDVWAAVAAARGLNPETLDDEGLRLRGVGEAASIVARIPQVRAALLEYQRAFAQRSPGAVLDGRDIGTVVCRDADAKLFVTATPEVRARRRHREWQLRGEQTTYEAVLADIKARDLRDTDRSVSPSPAGLQRLLARYVGFRYRCCIRCCCWIDQEEDQPIRLGRNGLVEIPFGGRKSPLRLQ